MVFFGNSLVRVSTIEQAVGEQIAKAERDKAWLDGQLAAIEGEYWARQAARRDEDENLIVWSTMEGRATVGEYCRAISGADTWRDAYGNSEHVLRDVFGDAPVDALIAANQNARS